MRHTIRFLKHQWFMLGFAGSYLRHGYIGGVCGVLHVMALDLLGFLHCKLGALGLQILNQLLPDDADRLDDWIEAWSEQCDRLSRASTHRFNRLPFAE